ncbi:MAG: NUDIX hydrolase [Nanoarchaeota archaeon]
MKIERKSVGIFPINSDKKVLLHLRDNDLKVECPGYWGVIGGEIDKGENDAGAIKREIKEEIGDIVKNVKRIGEIFVDKSEIVWKNTQLSIFKGEIDKTEDEIKLNEGQKVKFFNISELDSIKMVPLLKKYILENKEKIFS